MKMFRTTQQAKEFGKDSADTIFRIFSNKRNQGERFTWKEFPEIVSQLVDANLPTEKLKKTAVDAARKAAKTLSKHLC